MVSASSGSAITTANGVANVMLNYFEYFSEIEERFSRRRGSILLLNTLDWALIETWREAGIPLEAVLRGIDAAFDKYDARAHKARGRLRKVNGLAWCAQAVMQSAEELVEASTGLAPAAAREPRESGFECERVATFLDQNAQALEAAVLPDEPSDAVRATTAARLRELATSMRGPMPPALDDLDRTLTVLEEKLFAALQSSAFRSRACRFEGPGRSRACAVSREDVRRPASPGAAAVSAQAPP